MYQLEYDSKNYELDSQSASNSSRGTSTTLRGGSYVEYAAGVIDGAGNFDVRRSSDGKKRLQSIKIKLANRDIRILSTVKNILKCGKIRTNASLSTYQISAESELERVVKLLNGHIRLKVLGFVEACEYFDIPYSSANYVLSPNTPYLSGLIDTEGSISFVYHQNVINLRIELKQNEYSEKLNLDKAIPSFEPRVYKFHKRNQTKNKIFYSIRFDFTRVDKMIYLYNFSMSSRLYSDFKFYRFTQIKRFLEIRHFKNSKKGSPEHKAYSKWVINFVSHLNPIYTKLTYLPELSLS